MKFALVLATCVGALGMVGCGDTATAGDIAGEYVVDMDMVEASLDKGLGEIPAEARAQVKGRILEGMKKFQAAINADGTYTILEPQGPGVEPKPQSGKWTKQGEFYIFQNDEKGSESKKFRKDGDSLMMIIEEEGAPFKEMRFIRK